MFINFQQKVPPIRLFPPILLLFLKKFSAYTFIRNRRLFGTLEYIRLSELRVLLELRVLFEGRSYMRKYRIYILTKPSEVIVNKFFCHSICFFL